MIDGLVSTIIPVFNRGAMLREAVSSVLAQTYRPIEVLIVDDGSIDDTASVADDLAAKNPGELRVVHQQNTGPGLAREAGRQLANGEFIQYLDSDDLYYPTKVCLQVSALRDNSERDIAYCLVENFNVGSEHDPDPLPWGRSGDSVDVLFPQILGGRYWCTSAPLYRRSLSDRIGPWSSCRYEEDIEYDVRAACLGARAIQLREFLVRFRHHDARMSLDFTSRSAYGHQTQARLLICQHIISSGISLRDPAVQHYAQGLFLSARQIGAMGFADDADLCLTAARNILRHRKGGDRKSFFYSGLVRVGGHRLIGTLSKRYEALRNAVKSTAANGSALGDR